VRALCVRLDEQLREDAVQEAVADMRGYSERPDREIDARAFDLWYALDCAHCALLHTAHCALHTAHCALWYALCTPAHCTLHTLHCTLHTVYCITHGVSCVHCVLYTLYTAVHCILLYTVQHCVYLTPFSPLAHPAFYNTE
jgi:hypothetical protein